METMTLQPVQEPKYTRVYAYEEAMKASLAYFDGDELAANVWINKYALKDCRRGSGRR